MQVSVSPLVQNNESACKHNIADISKSRSKQHNCPMLYNVYNVVP